MGHKERGLVKNRVEAMDIVDDVLYYGDSKGFVYMVKLAVTEKKFGTKEVTTTKISKDAIVSLKAIKKMKSILVLSAGRIFILNSNNLEGREMQVGDSVRHLAVDTSGNTAISLDGKILIQLSSDSKVKEVAFADEVLRMAWNGELLGVASGKAYVAVDSVRSTEHEFSRPNGAVHPCVLVFGDYWVVANADSVVLHEKLGTPLPGSSIPIQEVNQKILEMIVKSFYLLVFTEKSADVYNLLDYNKVQRIAFDKECVYKTCAIYSSNLLLAMDIVMGYKKDLTSALVYLCEVPAEVQVRQLLGESKIAEAHSVFLQSCQSTSQDFEERREQFNIDAAWALFANLEFSRGEEYFLQTNYDPRELLTLVPAAMEPKHQRSSFTTLETLIQRKNGEVGREVVGEGVNSIILLLEEKRKYLSGGYSFVVDRTKPLSFVWPSTPLNGTFKGTACEYKEIMKIIDSSLLKLYTKNRQIKQLKNFIETAKDLQCNYKEMEVYLKDHFKDDLVTCSAEICQAFLYEKGGDYLAALNIWKELIEKENKEVRNTASRGMTDLLASKVRDKSVFKKYVTFLLISNPAEGLRIFTNSDKFHTLSEEEACDFLEKLEPIQPTLKVQYLEHLVKKPGAEERFETRLGLHYAGKVKEALTKDAGREYEEARKRFKDFLTLHKAYDTQAVLGAIKGMGLLQEEILLYSMQKMHNQALTSLTNLGKRYIDFEAAEKYCLEQSEALLALLFEKVVALYTELKVKHEEMVIKSTIKESEIANIAKNLEAYEEYCKSFLRKYATDEKMDAETVVRALPDEWLLSGGEESSVLDYLVLALKDRLGKDERCRIARHAAELLRTSLQCHNSRMQKAYVVIKSHNKCKACDKTLDARHFYVFPNGLVTHTHCAKDVNTCPVTNVNFAKRIYD